MSAMTESETDFARWLRYLIDYGSSAVSSIRTFRQAGIMTDDTGFVVKMSNGDVFQVTVVKDS